MNKMVKMALLALAFAFVSCTTDADDDSDDWSAAEVCPENGTNAYGMPNRGEFTDDRDGRVYKYTTIGDQVWMAENLKYEAENSECKEVFDGFCEIFGRYYSLGMDGKDASDFFDENRAEQICPNGWKIPSKNEWIKLLDKMGGWNENISINRLKSSLFWGKGVESGEDLCSFNLLPAGGGGDGLFDVAEFVFYPDGQNLVYEFISLSSGVSFHKSWFKLSIRCVKD